MRGGAGLDWAGLRGTERGWAGGAGRGTHLGDMGDFDLGAARRERRDDFVAVHVEAYRRKFDGRQGRSPQVQQRPCALHRSQRQAHVSSQTRAATRKMQGRTAIRT